MKFRIKAVQGHGEVVSLLTEARDADAAREQLRRDGLSVLSLRPVALALPRRQVRFALVSFTQELVSLVEAGLNVVESIEALAERETRADMQSVMAVLLRDLKRGQPLSDAVARHPACFPQLFVATINASERTGDLPQALRRYIQYETQIDVLRRKVINASIYPLLLLALGAAVTLFLLMYVVPRFAGVYEEVGRDIPALSQVLLAWGRALGAYPLEIAGAMLLGATGSLVWIRQPKTRAALLRRILRLPTIGERLRTLHLARFYRTVGMLLRAGIPVSTALSMSSGLVFADQRIRLAAACLGIDRGQAVSDSLQCEGLTTPVALRMLRVGEMSGELGSMMERIAGFYEDDLARFVDVFTRVFEPLLMAAIGVIIGAIIVLMYLPIFELAGSLQ